MITIIWHTLNQWKILHGYLLVYIGLSHQFFSIWQHCNNWLFLIISSLIFWSQNCLRSASAKFFFWYLLLLKSSTKIWSLNIRKVSERKFWYQKNRLIVCILKSNYLSTKYDIIIQLIIIAMVKKIQIINNLPGLNHPFLC